MIDALAKIAVRDVPRETFEKLESYVSLLIEANAAQNLISSSTVDTIWVRHILDSAQLISLASRGSWLDIGSGAGLPGVVIAILTGEPIVLLEPRRLRVEFLNRMKSELLLPNVTVVAGKTTALCTKFDKITARAVAPAPDLFAMAHHLSRRETVWLLPKGRSAQKELDATRASWQGQFRLEASRTDAGASILIASRVQPRGKR